MVIVIIGKEEASGHTKPPDLNVEVTLFQVDGETDDYMVEGYVDLRELDIGDQYSVCEYIAVDGSTLSTFLCTTFTGKQDQPVLRFHTKTLLSFFKYKVTILALYGYLREIYYGFIKEIMGTA